MRALWLACTIACVATRSAFGDGAGVISAGGRDRVAVATAMADAIGARATIPDAVADARAAVAGGAVAIETIARFRRVRELVDEGWRAYLRVAAEFAAQRLATARGDAEPLVALPGGAEVYADATLRLGVVLDHLGRKAEAQRVLALALALDPERPITLAEFSPDVLELVDAVRASPPELRTLAIATVPPGAALRVDGAPVDRSPHPLAVARGQHVIVARMPRHRASVRGVAVDAATTVELELDPDPELGALARGAELGLAMAAQQALVDATLRYADLDQVVVVAEVSRRGGSALLVQRCSGIPARCTAIVEIGYGDRAGLAAAARAAWDAVRTGELREPPSALGERPGREPARRCEACRSPWLWTGVGVGLAIGAVVTTLAVTSGSRPAPSVGVDPGDFVRR